jgi:hypothetical protein
MITGRGAACDRAMLLVLWLLGFLVIHIGGAFIHILIVMR